MHFGNSLYVHNREDAYDDDHDLSRSKWSTLIAYDLLYIICNKINNFFLGTEGAVVIFYILLGIKLSNLF